VALNQGNSDNKHHTISSTTYFKDDVYIQSASNLFLDTWQKISTTDVGWLYFGDYILLQE